MPPDTPHRNEPPPLASYVLRIQGRPATLVYELHDVRTGQRRRFGRAAALLAFLAEHGLAEAPLWPPAHPPQDE